MALRYVHQTAFGRLQAEVRIYQMIRLSHLTLLEFYSNYPWQHVSSRYLTIEYL